MTNPPKKRGTAWETAICRLLAEHGFPHVERRALTGNQAMQQVKAGLKDGTLSIWKGPIADNTGKEVLAKDAVADDKFLLGINFYVKGVQGKLPSAK